VTPVIIGATGTISKSFRQYLSDVPGEHEIKELPKKNSHIGHCKCTAEINNIRVRT